MTIAKNILKIKNDIGEGVQLVAVSKNKPEEDIRKAYNAGHRSFGENKVQELVSKHMTLPDDIEWHFIGHLQTNKIRQIVQFVHLIHGVDSLKLLQSINKEGNKINRSVCCLLQFHIAEEETKFGLSYTDAVEILLSPEFSSLANITVRGVMGMATYTNDEDQVRKEFRELKHIFDRLKDRFFKSNDQFSEISMGMSDDYHIAVEEGSNIVRIGSSIFGERN